MKLVGVVLLLIIILLVAVTLLCHIIAIVTPHWLRSSDSVRTNFLNLGLWMACFDNYEHRHELPKTTYTGCYDIYDKIYARIRDWLIPSWLNVCQILSMIALVLLIVGIVLLILLFLCVICKWLTCNNKEGGGWCERIILYVTPISFILAGVFLMMTVMVFADNAFRLQCRDFWVGGDPNTNRLGFSWGFELAACILSFVSGGFLLWLVVLKGRDDI